MAAPAFKAAGTFVGSASTASPGIPAGTVAGDILLLFVESENEAISLSNAQGFAELGTQAGQGSAGGSTSSRIAVFWKRATGSDAAPTVADAGDHVACRIGSFEGCIATGDPWDGTPTWTHDAVSDTVLAANGPTTTVADCLVVIGAANIVDSNTAQTVSYSNANLTSLGGTGMGDNTNQGTGGGLNVGTGIKASAGAVGATTCTWGANTQKSVVVLALKPVAAATLERSAAIGATGAITASGTFWTTFDRSAALSATADIASAGTGFTPFERAAALDAAGVIASSGTFWTTFDRSVALDATGGIASTGEVEGGFATVERAAALDATGSIASVPQRELLRQSAVGASAGIASSGQFFSILEGSAALGATGALASAGLTVRERAAVLAAAAGIASVPQRDLLRAVVLAAVADINATGQVGDQPIVHNRSASLAATASIAASALGILERAAALTATGSLASAALRDLLRAASLGAVAGIATDGERDVVRSSALDALAAISATGAVPVDWSYDDDPNWHYTDLATFAYTGGTASTYGDDPDWTYHGGD